MFASWGVSRFERQDDTTGPLAFLAGISRPLWDMSEECGRFVRSAADQVPFIGSIRTHIFLTKEVSWSRESTI